MQQFDLPNHDRPNFHADAPTGYRFVSSGFLLPDQPCNFITHFRSREMKNPTHDGFLSIKAARGGQEVYELQGARHAVEDNHYLILNAGNPYGCSIHSDQDVESFCVFFKPGAAEEVLGSLVTPRDKLLDQPNPIVRQPLRFFERCYPHDAILSPRLEFLRRTLLEETPTPGWLEEQFHLLLYSLLCVHRNVSREIESMPRVRYATRVELYQRLYRARDYMEASLGEPITLHQIAEVAWFSPHHFLRLFHQVFKETPHQYLTRRRIERARELLNRTEMPVTEVCFEVGFVSLGSFSSLFRRETGFSPSEYRQKARQK